MSSMSTLEDPSSRLLLELNRVRNDFCRSPGDRFLSTWMVIDFLAKLWVSTPGRQKDATRKMSAAVSAGVGTS